MLRLILLLVSLHIFSPAFAEIYQWKDADGKIHYGEEKDANNKGVKSVEIRDKYAIPVVEVQTAIKYSGAKAHREMGFNNLKLSLPDSDIESVRIGRFVCGKPIDLYWKKGFVDLLDSKIVGASISKFTELGYTIRNSIKGTPSSSSLGLEAEIIDIKINMCPSTHAPDVTQNATYLKIKWSLTDPMSGEKLFTGESSGSHDVLKNKPVKGGTDASIGAALAVATNNILADREFVKHFQPIDVAALVKKFDEKISVQIQYGAGTDLFKNRTEKLMGNTVIVKTTDSFGSGVIINSDGYLLTNAHVVGQEKKFNVLINGENNSAELVRKEVIRDVALIKLSNGSPASGVEVSREKPKVGDEIYIIGTPLALENSQTTTKGIISAFREIQGLNYFQTDAAVNHGSSGGPVFNERGELIALTVSGLLTRDGAGLSINYLIPIDDVFRYLNLDGAINQNKTIAAANKWVESIPASSDKNSLLSKLHPMMMWLVDWLNSPLFPTQVGNSSKSTSDYSQVPELAKVSSPNALSDKVEASYRNRANFANAVLLVNPLRYSISDYYQQHNEWPLSFSDIGIDSSNLQQAGIVDDVELQRGGVLHVNLAAATFGQDHYFNLVPDESQEGKIKWECKTTLASNLWTGDCKGLE